MRLVGEPSRLITALGGVYPEVPDVLRRARSLVSFNKRQIAEWQAAALYVLAKPYDSARANVLEIGTQLGYSAAVLAQACPHATIITLNPKMTEVAEAAQNLKAFPNVTVVALPSWDYLAVAGQVSNREGWDVIFVDGDHKQVERDLPWFNELKPGGLMLFHDYSPALSPRPCPPVYEALNAMADTLRRPLDVYLADTTEVGLAGFYRQRGELFGGLRSAPALGVAPAEATGGAEAPGGS